MPTTTQTFLFCCFQSILTVTHETLISGPFVGGERCGSEYPLPNGNPSKCNPNNPPQVCCSPSGWCSEGDDWCSCPGCVDYRVVAREEGCTSLPSHVTSLAPLPVLVGTVIAVTLICPDPGSTVDERAVFTCQADRSWARETESTCTDTGK